MKRKTNRRLAAAAMAAVMTASIAVPAVTAQAVESAETEILLSEAEEQTEVQTESAAEEPAEATVEADAAFQVAFDATSDWSEPEGNCQDMVSLATETAPEGKVTLKFSLLLPAEKAAFNGIIKPVGVLRVGSGWEWTQSDTIPELNAASFGETVEIDGAAFVKADVEIPFAQEITDAISAVTVKLAGWQCDYDGTVYLQNAVLDIAPAQDSEGGSEAALSWDFESGIDGWRYDSGWNSSYDGEGGIEAADGMMKVSLDHSANTDASWSQTAITYDAPAPMDLTNVNELTVDYYYNPAAKTMGGLKLKAYAGYGINCDLDINEETAEDVEINGTAMKKAHVVFSFDALTESAAESFSLAFIGNNTDYKGDVYLDNVTFNRTIVKEDIYVNSTAAREDRTNLSVSGGNFVSQQEDGTSENTALNTSAKMVDKNATEAASKVYALLQASGKSESVIFGHQNDTWHKAGSADLSSSDVKDVTGSISGVIGLDTLSLIGDEYSAQRYNDSHETKLDVETLGLARANVKAAALLTNECISEGSVITLSSHMPNFSVVKENPDYDPEKDPSYARYDFSGYTAPTLTGDVMNQILPGGQYHDEFTAYLDLIADYASQVDGAVLFRPFHENTGSWFWWGAAFCDAQTYKNVYRFTVEYMRDEKGIHNFIYEYGPGSEAANETEYEERYPGDAYVDLIGFDMYNTDPQEDNSAWIAKFKDQLALVDSFAEKHGKLVAVTETGVASSNGNALLKSGNLNKTWFAEVTDAVSESSASYFLVWANWSEGGSFYTPYVKRVNEDGTLYGHEMLDNFIEFYNDGRSIFAEDLKGILEQMPQIQTESASEAVSGYITAPVSGSRILEAVEMTARVTGASADTSVQFVLHGDGTEAAVEAVSEDGVYYHAQLDLDTLKSLGEVFGTIELVINGESSDSINAIFNIEKPAEDPYQIDGFENYNGVDSLLNKSWAVNKATGSTISLKLTKAEDKVFEGSHALEFTYDETSDGWAGATISKEVDWSDCNAVQFYTIPDGNNQKVVIQIQANNTCYEAYLNLYEDYATAEGPVKVTIPFSEFGQRDTQGNPKGGLVEDCVSVTSFGLWVNAIGDSEAIVDGRVGGTIYYDDITAVTSDKTEAVFEAIVKEPETEEPETEEPETEESETEEPETEEPETEESETEESETEESETEESETEESETEESETEESETEGSETETPEIDAPMQQEQPIVKLVKAINSILKSIFKWFK